MGSGYLAKRFNARDHSHRIKLRRYFFDLYTRRQPPVLDLQVELARNFNLSLDGTHVTLSEEFIGEIKSKYFENQRLFEPWGITSPACLAMVAVLHPSFYAKLDSKLKKFKPDKGQLCLLCFAYSLKTICTQCKRLKINLNDDLMAEVQLASTHNITISVNSKVKRESLVTNFCESQFLSRDVLNPMIEVLKLQRWARGLLAERNLLEVLAAVHRFNPKVWRLLCLRLHLEFLEGKLGGNQIFGFWLLASSMSGQLSPHEHSAFLWTISKLEQEPLLLELAVRAPTDYISHGRDLVEFARRHLRPNPAELSRWVSLAFKTPDTPRRAEILEMVSSDPDSEPLYLHSIEKLWRGEVDNLNLALDQLARSLIPNAERLTSWALDYVSPFTKDHADDILLSAKVLEALGLSKPRPIETVALNLWLGTLSPSKYLQHLLLGLTMVSLAPGRLLDLKQRWASDQLRTIKLDFKHSHLLMSYREKEGFNGLFFKVIEDYELSATDLAMISSINFRGYTSIFADGLEIPQDLLPVAMALDPNGHNVLALLMANPEWLREVSESLKPKHTGLETLSHFPDSSPREPYRGYVQRSWKRRYWGP